MIRFNVSSKILMLLTLAASMACGTTFQVVVDTTPLISTSGVLAFDLIQGSGIQVNTVTVSGFASDGTLGLTSFSGSVTGDLNPGPLTLVSDVFFSEFLQSFDFGSTLSFQFDTTVSVGDPIPDAFSFYLLDDTLTPYATSDPSGANALFMVALDGTAPAVFTSDFATATVLPVTSGVPEPASFAISLLGIAVLGVIRGRVHGS